MNPNRLAAVPVRWAVVAVFALWAVGLGAPAQPVQTAKPNSITGVYNGTFAGEQGPIKFKLSVTQQDRDVLAGTFTLYLPDGAGTKAYTCDIKGRYVPVNRQVMVTRGKWETPPPGGIDMLGMIGQFDPDGAKGAGQISGKVRGRSNPGFEAIRDADESAKLADAAKKDTVSPASPAAPPPGANRPAPKAGAPPSGAPAPVIDTSLPTAINGVYTGGYQAGGNVLKARLSLKSTDDGTLTGFFTFDLPASSGSGSATYKLTGKFVAGNRWPFQFTTVEPVGEPAPDAYAFKTLSACFGQGGLVQGKNGIEYSVNLDRISGPVSGGRGSIAFEAVRDKAASADLDKAMAAQASAATHPAPAAPEARPAFEGVYTGSYTGKEGPAKFKLTLWMQKENRTLSGEVVSSDLAGVLTLNLPDGAETRTYTAELAGMINPQRNLQLTVKRWEARPPTNIGGLSGKFDPDGGGHGVGQISGYLSDASNSKLEATRDAAESAKMDIAALTGNVRPGIPGVFNGTYTRANQPPAKIKLTITRNGDGPRGIAGMATLYLPSGSGEKAYTYSLVGALDGYDTFHLAVHDWETAPPADFDLKGMGFNGKVVLNLAENTARVVSAPAAGSLASFYVPQFEATWDATESAHVDRTIAAQKSIGADEQAAALKAHEEKITHEPPKELASKDQVRKSRQYWGGFDEDMLREVFDGGFGPGIDEETQFQKVFCTYVEMFAARHPECLPPDHQQVSIIWRTNRKFDGSGNLISEENHDFTVDMDPRFVDGYKRCWKSLTSRAEGLREALVAAQPGGAQRTIHDMLGITTDVQRFFADHPCASAAMRQLTENFVRAIRDQPSLQQAGERVDGAEAESDKDLPPGRYARFVDGANAYFRARAKADPVRYGGRLAHDTALCQRLAELYQFSMSPQESYYYANDFAARFLPIMGPRASCPDPAWPRLHPQVERAVADVN